MKRFVTLKSYKSYFVGKFYTLYNYYSEYQLFRSVPGLRKIFDDYKAKTNSTGTKFPTLYRAVKIIQKHRPEILLESGTGLSTIVLAETLRQLKARDSTYHPRIISMESIEKWHGMAVELLPDQYRSFVEIRLGPREKYEYSIFRGYCHTNIPNLDYDFVFLDGPSYSDPKGATSCLDAIKVRLSSRTNRIRTVVDTRVSSVFVMQCIFGGSVLKYRSWHRTCSFEMHPIHDAPGLSSVSFNNHASGRLSLKPTSFLPN